MRADGVITFICCATVFLMQYAQSLSDLGLIDPCIAFTRPAFSRTQLGLIAYTRKSLDRSELVNVEERLLGGTLVAAISAEQQEGWEDFGALNLFIKRSPQFQFLETVFEWGEKTRTNYRNQQPFEGNVVLWNSALAWCRVIEGMLRDHSENTFIGTESDGLISGEFHIDEDKRLIVTKCQLAVDTPDGYPTPMLASMASLALALIASALVGQKRVTAMVLDCKDFSPHSYTPNPARFYTPLREEEEEEAARTGIHLVRPLRTDLLQIPPKTANYSSATVKWVDLNGFARDLLQELNIAEPRDAVNAGLPILVATAERRFGVPASALLGVVHVIESIPIGSGQTAAIDFITLQAPLAAKVGAPYMFVIDGYTENDGLQPAKVLSTVHTLFISLYGSLRLNQYLGNPFALYVNKEMVAALKGHLARISLYEGMGLGKLVAQLRVYEEKTNQLLYSRLHQEEDFPQRLRLM